MTQYQGIIAVLSTLALTTSVRGQDITLRIELANAPQAQFRIGEVIPLKLVFEKSADSEAPLISIESYGRSVLGLFGDRFVVSPDLGTRDPWEYRRNGLIAYSGLGGRTLHEKTTVIPVDLNQWVRFERPGHYAVHAEIHVLGRSIEPGQAVVSNVIGIDIVAADPAWQADQLREALAELNTASAKESAAKESAARRIAYLDTPASVREMARLLASSDQQLGYIFDDGLRSTAHPAEALAAMKEVFESSCAPVTQTFLNTLSALERKQSPADYQAELARQVERKQGPAKAISLKTLLDQMPAEAITPQLRSEMAAVFLELPSPEQSSTLHYGWSRIRSADMIPVLRRIIDTAPQSPYPPYPPNDLFAIAVERLYELDPGQARTIILDEMDRSAPRLPYHTLAMLSDATLPGLDPVFLDHLEHNGGQPAEELIARYSTAAILDPVKAFYAKRDREMRERHTVNQNIAAPACEPPLVAYFLRVDPAFGEQVLRATLAGRSYPLGRCWLNIVSRAAQYYSGPAWEKVAMDATGDPSVAVKSDAVKALGEHGSLASASAIWESFRYWHEWWKDRPAELNDENRRFEMVFLEATTHPKNRVPTAADRARARDLCITSSCRSQVQ